VAQKYIIGKAICHAQSPNLRPLHDYGRHRLQAQRPISSEAMERRGIAIWWSASLFELLHSLLDLLFQFHHISLASGCRKYFD